MPSLFRRKPDDERAAEAHPATSDPEPGTDGADADRSRPDPKVTPPKGRATPKRPPARRVVEPPPANMREASRRLRERERAERARAVATGDDSALLPRDRGPDKALARDVVDTRRNPTTLFIPVALVVTLVFCSPLWLRSTGVSAASMLRLQAVFNAIFYLMVAVLLVDGYLISRRIRAAMARRLPDHRAGLGLYIYASQRAVMPRRFRQPRPRLGPNDQV